MDDNDISPLDFTTMIVAVFVFIFGLCDFGDGSAIPVWEFLKKEEKVLITKSPAMTLLMKFSNL